MKHPAKKPAFGQNDTFLIRELRKGNEQAFEQLFRIYHQPLYGFLMQFAGSQSDVEDILQEVFIRIWERRGDLNENLSFSGLMFTIGRNLCLNMLRNERCRRHIRDYLKSVIDHSLDDVEQIIYFNELDQMVHQVLDQLPDRQKQIYKLNRVEGLSRKEIAEELQISLATVDMHMSRALGVLRRHLYKVRDSG